MRCREAARLSCSVGTREERAPHSLYEGTREASAIAFCQTTMQQKRGTWWKTSFIMGTAAAAISELDTKAKEPPAALLSLLRSWKRPQSWELVMC